MAKILDYHCGYDNTVGLGQWTEKNPLLQFPQAYLQRELVAELALTIKEHNQAAFCLLPFCHTLEAEALGADIFLGDGLTGPRAREYRCGSLQEVMERSMDDTTPRLQETLEACRMLKHRGERVLFQLSGPLTILNSLLPSELLFRALRKEPEQLLQVFEKIGEDILRLAVLAEKAGANLISYADPMGGVNIIGPKSAEWIAKGFTVGFLHRLDEQLEKDTMVLLCPKTAFALIGTELAEWQDHVLPETINYGKAALCDRGSIRFLAQSCVKKAAYETKILKELILK